MFVKRKDWEQLNRKVKALENAVKAISERTAANSFYFGRNLTLQDYVFRTERVLNKLIEAEKK